MDLLTQVAEKVGVTPSELQASIQSGIDAYLAVHWVIGILFFIGPLVFWIGAWFIDEFDAIAKKVHYVMFVLVVLGIYFFFTALHDTVAYESIYMSKVLDLARELK